MKHVLVLALGLLSLAVAPIAHAADAGFALGTGQVISESGASAASNGGSFSALAGITAQGSQAGSFSTGGAGLFFNNNNTQALSGQTSGSSQSGFSASLGVATSVNGNVAQGVGQSGALGNLTTLYGFIVP
jgi:hypothetical protein